MADWPRVPARRDRPGTDGPGRERHETIDICGYALDRAFPTGSLAQGVSVQPVRSRDDVARFERTSAQAWGYPAPSEEDIDRTFANSTVGFFIGSWHGVPAGAGGYALVGCSPASGEQRWCLNSEAEGSTEDWSMPEWRMRATAGRNWPWCTPGRPPRPSSNDSGSPYSASGRSGPSRYRAP